MLCMHLYIAHVYHTLKMRTGNKQHGEWDNIIREENKCLGLSMIFGDIN